MTQQSKRKETKRFDLFEETKTSRNNSLLVTAFRREEFVLLDS